PYWHGTLADLQEAISTLGARYDRDMIVVETAYPFTLEDDPRAPFPNIVDAETALPEGYPPTPGGQAAFFRAVQDVTAAAEGGRGRGVVYWEPAWTAVEGAGWDPEDPSSGNAWENQAMFDFSGAALPELLADQRTTALVTREGDVDWLCLPRFDSDAVFCSLLGTEDHGHWSLRIADGEVVSRRYLPGTMVLETQWRSPTGTATVTEFMP